MKFLIVFIAAVAAVAAAPGSISVYNVGGYVATCTVDYDLDGQRKSESTGDFSLGVTKTIQIPDGASKANVKCEEYWFPGQKTTIFTKSIDGDGGPVTKTFKIWGTTLNPSHAEIS